MATVPAFASAADALEVVRAGLRFLAAADATRDRGRAGRVPAGPGAGRRGRDRGADLDAGRVRRRAGLRRGRGLQPVLVAAAPDPGHPRHRRGAHRLGQARRAAHPAVHAALAAEAISKSYAREICRWTGSLPEDARAAADEILLAAAAAGLELEDLARLAAEMYEKSRQDKPDTATAAGRGRAGRGVR